MTIKDDRAEFEQQKTRNIEEMGKDKELFEASSNLILASDRHRYSYLWSWMGAPIIQRPADVLALQEAVWRAKPDVIVETGVARGGSVVFFASLMSLMNKPRGKVIGVDIEIRPHNRDTINNHPLADRIELIEGSSIDPQIVQQVKASIPADASVMIVLDSDHSRDHVLAELRAYSALVTPGQYLVAADTILGFFSKEQAPTYYSKVLMPGNEPLTAVRSFLAENDQFALDEINGKLIMSSSPGGFLRRVR